MKIKALILWHYYNADGVIFNASSTMFEGTPDELHTRIQDEYTENGKRREKKMGHTIPQQIIILDP